MTDRGLPIVDGAPACPFVAFEDDRDGRALAPDHRHRCFAEPRPAPRALAHQEAYCLSSAFPVCPTFQDWARREAAAARPSALEDRTARDEPPLSTPLPPREREGYRAPGDDAPPPIPPRRHQPRDWAAPPPWSDDEGEAGPRPAAADVPPFLAGRAASSEDPGWGTGARGLAGSAADRLAGPDPSAPMEPAGVPPYRSGRAAIPATPRDEDDEDLDDEGPWSPAPSARPAAAPPGARRGVDRAADRGTSREARREQVRRRREEEAADLFGPAWEKPQRYEAYPTLRTRMGLPSFSGLWVAVLAIVLAAVVLFFVGPMLLGLGGKSPDTGGASPTSSAEASASPSPTLPPAPTPQVYVVAKGDTMSRIATKFGVTMEALLAANPQVKNPDKITIGDQLTIPVPVDSAVPDQVQGSTAPQVSAAP